MSGLLGGGGGGGAQRICWPPSKIIGGPCPLPPPPPPVPTPMLILSFKEESDISSLNGHVEMTTNTVIRLWMHRLVRTCAFGVDARVKADCFHDLS